MVFAISAVAAATTTPVSVARADSAVALGDGQRTWAVWQPSSHSALVHRKGAPDLTVDAPDECILGAVGAGRLLFDCPDPGQPDKTVRAPLWFGLATGTWTIPAGVNAILERERQAASDGEFDSMAWDGIGGALIAQTVITRSGVATGFVDPQTGEEVNPTTGSRSFATLNTTSGKASLCAPVTRKTRRAEFPYSGSGKQLQSAAVTGAWTLRWWSDTGLTRSRSLLLQRCGAKRARVLASAGFSEPLLTSGYVAWMDGSTLHTFATRTGRSSRWKVPGATARSDLRLSGTARRVFVNGAQGVLVQRSVPGAGG